MAPSSPQPVKSFVDNESPSDGESTYAIDTDEGASPAEAPSRRSAQRKTTAQQNTSVNSSAYPLPSPGSGDCVNEPPNRVRVSRVLPMKLE